MTTMPLRVTAGVDTHLDVHVAAVLDDRGGLLGVESFATTPAGYRGLLGWLRGFGAVELVGVEGTGSYGAGLTRHLHREGVRVVEVDRPNRQRRRRRGKSDPQDAVSAARSAQSGDARGEAKTRDGNVEAMRVLRVARSSARKARTQALNQMRSIVATGPEPIRAELRDLTVYRLLERAAGYRPGQRRDVMSLTKRTLRILARRAQALEAEVAELDTILKQLVAETAPALAARPGVGTECASVLLVAAGDNPQRLRNDATFAHLCGAAPSTPAAANTNATGSTAAATAKPTPRCGTSSSPAWSTTPAPATTSNAASTKASPRKKPSVASSATSPARSTTTYPTHTSPLTAPRSIVLGWSSVSVAMKTEGRG
jgi:transposase